MVWFGDGWRNELEAEEDEQGKSVQCTWLCKAKEQMLGRFPWPKKLRQDPGLTWEHGLVLSNIAQPNLTFLPVPRDNGS